MSVDAGGCSGFSYVFEIEPVEERDEEDVVVEEDGMEIVTDKISLGFISECVLVLAYVCSCVCSCVRSCLCCLLCTTFSAI